MALDHLFLTTEPALAHLDEPGMNRFVPADDVVVGAGRGNRLEVGQVVLGQGMRRLLAGMVEPFPGPEQDVSDDQHKHDRRHASADFLRRDPFQDLVQLLLRLRQLDVDVRRVAHDGSAAFIEVERRMTLLAEIAFPDLHPRDLHPTPAERTNLDGHDVRPRKGGSWVPDECLGGLSASQTKAYATPMPAHRPSRHEISLILWPDSRLLSAVDRFLSLGRS